MRIARIDKVTGQRAYFLLVLFAFLFPTFPAFTRTDTAGRIGDMALVLGILAFIALSFVVFDVRVRGKYLIASIAIASVFILLITLSLFFEISRISVRDAYEYHKPLFILLIFLFFASNNWNDKALAENYIKPYRYLFVFFIFYALIEAYTGPVGNTISTMIYKNTRPILYGKATGSFGVTYFFGAFMLMSVFFFLFRSILRKNRRDFFLFLLSLIALLSSQSRTIFLSLCVGFFYLALSYWAYRSFPHKKGLYISFLVLAVLIAILWQPVMTWAANTYPYLYVGLAHLIESGGVSPTGGGSANLRYQQFLWAWENQFSFPIIGAGIGKGNGPLLESFYSLYLYRYGFLGIGIAVTLLALNYFWSLKCYKAARKRGNLDAAAFFLAFSVFCVTLPTSSLSSVITDQPRFAVLYYGTMAVMLLYHQQSKYEESSAPDLRSRKV